ncbi:hypothetical protein ABBQ32_013024 [Trebouxia sp. C0010 RCD-2024]
MFARKLNQKLKKSPVFQPVTIASCDTSSHLTALRPSAISMNLVSACAAICFMVNCRFSAVHRIMTVGAKPLQMLMRSCSWGSFADTKDAVTSTNPARRVTAANSHRRTSSSHPPSPTLPNSDHPWSQRWAEIERASTSYDSVEISGGAAASQFHHEFEAMEADLRASQIQLDHVAALLANLPVHELTWGPRSIDGYETQPWSVHMYSNCNCACWQDFVGAASNSAQPGTMNTRMDWMLGYQLDPVWSQRAYRLASPAA